MPAPSRGGDRPGPGRRTAGDACDQARGAQPGPAWRRRRPAAARPSAPGPAAAAADRRPRSISATTTLDSPRRLTRDVRGARRRSTRCCSCWSTGTPFSLAIDPAANGSFRGELKQLTLRDALTALLAPLGLDFHVQGTVHPGHDAPAETRLFDLNLLNVQRGCSGRTGGDGARHRARSAGRRRSDRRSGRRREGAPVRERARARGRPRRPGAGDATSRIGSIASRSTSRRCSSGARRQVRLQAQVFEVTLTRRGVDRLARRARASRAAGRRRGGGLRGRSASRCAPRWPPQGEIRDLWAPDVTALNNEPALVRVATPGGSSLTMTVVPQISADGIVQLSVVARVGGARTANGAQGCSSPRR